MDEWKESTKGSYKSQSVHWFR